MTEININPEDTISKERLAHALGYPYARPEHSFSITVSSDDAATTVSQIRAGSVQINKSRWRAKLGADGVDLYDIEAETMDGRKITKEAVYPVLAIGANGAPETLEHVFGRQSRQGLFDGDRSMVVTHCKITNYTVVSAACFSNSGSVPATLDFEQDAQTEVSITWLDTQQLERMNLSEPNYSLDQLQDCVAQIENGAIVPMPLSYICVHGAFVPGADGKPLALSAIKGTTSLRRCTQEEIQQAAKELLEPQETLTGFVLSHIFNGSKLQSHKQLLSGRFAKVIGGLRKTLLPRLDQPVSLTKPVTAGN